MSKSRSRQHFELGSQRTQIKNIVSAARALAKEIDELLSMTHLNTVLDTMLAWKDERNEETPPSPPTGLLVRTDTMQSDLLV